MFVWKEGLMSYCLVITDYVVVVLSEYRGNWEVCALFAGLIFPVLLQCRGAKTHCATFELLSFSMQSFGFKGKLINFNL